MPSEPSGIQLVVSILGPVLSLGVLTFVIRLSAQVRHLHAERIEAAKEKTSVIEERLRLAEDQLRSLDRISDNVTKIGAGLGIEEFRDQQESSVKTGNIGDGFSGRIAGRDINEVLSEIGTLITTSQNAVQECVDKSARYVDASANLLTQRDVPGAFEYKLDFVHGRGKQLDSEFQRKLAQYAEKGWTFYGLSADYRGTEGCVLVFRRHKGTESFHRLQASKELLRMIQRLESKKGST